MSNNTNANGIDVNVATTIQTCREWEAKTVAFTVNEIHINAAGVPYYETVPVTVADARAVFDAAQAAAGVDYWKNGFRVNDVPLARLILTARALEFFHGAPPVCAQNKNTDATGQATFTLYTAGYAC